MSLIYDLQFECENLTLGQLPALALQVLAQHSAAVLRTFESNMHLATPEGLQCL